MPFLSSLSYSISVVVNVTIFRFMQCSLESACHDVWILKCLHLLVQTSGLSLISNTQISFSNIQTFNAVGLQSTYFVIKLIIRTLYEVCSHQRIILSMTNVPTPGVLISTSPSTTTIYQMLFIRNISLLSIQSTP